MSNSFRMWMHEQLMSDKLIDIVYKGAASTYPFDDIKKCESLYLQYKDSILTTITSDERRYQVGADDELEIIAESTTYDHIRVNFPDMLEVSLVRIAAKIVALQLTDL